MSPLRARTAAVPRRPVLLGTAASVTGMTPVFLLGTFAVGIRDELGLSLTLLGFTVATFRITGGLAAKPLGSLLDRVGPVAGLTAALCWTAVTSLAVAGLVRGAAALVATIALAGVAAVVGQVSAALLLARSVEASRLGVGLAVQLSALPVAAALTGALLPLLGPSAWRGAFVLHALAAAALAALFHLRRWTVPAPSPVVADAPPIPGSIQLGFTVVLLLGMAAAMPLTAFVVETARAGGLGPTVAGAMLIAGSGLTIAVRITAGRAADRGRIAPLPAVAAMLAGSAAGYALLGLGRAPAIVAGAVIAFGLGWGFLALLFLAVLRLRSSQPGAAMGAMLPGGFAGGMAGPALFGMLADAASLRVAWTAAGGVALTAALLTVVTVVRVRRWRRATAGTP